MVALVYPWLPSSFFVSLNSSQVAAGFISIAVANMANAIKKISLQRGYDVANYALCCFGGAGGQLACLIAETLGIWQTTPTMAAPTYPMSLQLRQFLMLPAAKLFSM